ncbi:Hypothetical predicted protein [Scomber scombrus]|uniref:Secreted protein n=1 Tax=Scomber scombrus TaxID=13677 RepID=A0AAV1Q585_SCOSC
MFLHPDKSASCRTPAALGLPLFCFWILAARAWIKARFPNDVEITATEEFPPASSSERQQHPRTVPRDDVKVSAAESCFTALCLHSDLFVSVCFVSMCEEEEEEAAGGVKALQWPIKASSSPEVQRDN